jgi:FtsP/CotA-like multicopper oxidase with cupredoxin domain
MYGHTRQFLLLALLGGALLGDGAASAQTPLPGGRIPKYVEPVYVPPVIDATTGRGHKVVMSEIEWQVLPAGYPATTVWAYNQSYPGPTIVARRGVAATLVYVNGLKDPRLLATLPYDQTVHWADPLGLGCAMREPPVDCVADPADPCCAAYAGPVPTAVHLHGGEVPSEFDGGPESWFTADGRVGPGYVTNVYRYPNGQEATTLFYHDHALGATRLNVFAGLAGFYLLKDPASERPDLPAGAYEVGLALQDRSFDTNGQWYFPSAGVNPDVHPFWMPEFFGDVVVVNGRSWPYLDVEPRRVRLHLLNGSNARFYTLAIVKEPKGAPGPRFWQIGSDGGYLPRPVPRSEITLAPGERVDVVVDFTGVAPGTRYRVVNSARAPFPMGDVPDPDTVGQIMQLRVVKLRSRDTTVPMSKRLDLRPANPLVSLHEIERTSVPVRRLTLNEDQGPGGPLQVLVNNSKWDAKVTEVPRVGATEIWEIVNLTADTHPIHLHLVQFQLLDRQPFDAEGYAAAYAAAFPGGAYLAGSGPPLDYGACAPGTVCGGNPDLAPFLDSHVPPVAPGVDEAGWKDTFRMNPGEVSRVVVRFAPQDVPLGGVEPGKNLFPFDPVDGGPGYVWHCHIIDHEDNEMMRPYFVSW